MKRTNKNVKETAKPAPQPAFNTPAQELEEFKAKVLAMKHGLLIWVQLDARVSLNQTCQRVQDDGPLIRDAYSFSEWWQALEAVVPGKELLAAQDEIHRRVAELWPEYERLLKRDPEALKAYMQRYEQNCILRKVGRGARELLPQTGAPQRNAGRDELICRLYEEGTEKTDQQVANKLEHKYGIKMSRQAVRRAYDREEERRRRHAAKLNSR